MDLKSIQSLGEMTNRVIEIKQTLNAIANMAMRVLNEDGSCLHINLDFSTHTDVVNEIDNYLKEIFITDRKKEASSNSIENISKRVATIRLEGKYQMIAFEALTIALEQELSDVSALIKLKTGTL